MRQKNQSYLMLRVCYNPRFGSDSRSVQHLVSNRPNVLMFEIYMLWLLEASTTLSERFMRSWARQRFVAASSRRTDEKVASRKGSGKH